MCSNFVLNYGLIFEITFLVVVHPSMFQYCYLCQQDKSARSKKKAFEFASDNYDYGPNIEKGPRIMHSDSVHETRLKNPSRPRKGEKKVLQDGEMDA